MISRKLSQPVYTGKSDPVVEISSGKLQGIVSDGTYMFRGIPYARAERFELAQPVEPWSGVRLARCWGYVSPELNTKIAADEAICPHIYWRADEHCQNLNLWTPSLNPNAKLPVIVWMHGGGWVSGSSIEQRAYDGENLSKRGNLVLVNFNSRQNCLGALDLSSFGEAFEHSVFCGLSDVLAAMRWIQNNIAAFGGDPNNVTVIGQAGGGKRALALMQTPAADGLYHKMAIGSCAGERMSVPDGWTRKQIAQRMGELVAEELGLSEQTIGQIRSVPYDELARAVRRADIKIKKDVPDRFRWEPIADGVHYFDDPFATDFRPETNGIPMMTGSSYSEMMGNSRVKIGNDRKNTWSEGTVYQHARVCYGTQAETVWNAYRQAYPEHPVADLLYVDRKIRGKLISLTKKRAAAGNRVWNWLFQLEAPIDGGLTAWHCAENPFVLHNAQYIEAAYIPGVSERLQDQMADAWIRFARTGDPNGDGLPEWKTATGESLPTMLFGGETTVRVDHDLPLQRLFHEEL